MKIKMKRDVDLTKIQNMKNNVNIKFDSSFAMIQDSNKKILQEIENIKPLSGTDFFQILFFQQFKVLMESFRAIEIIGNITMIEYLKYSKRKLYEDVENIEILFDETNKRFELLEQIKSKSENDLKADESLELKNKKVAFALLSSLRNISDDVIDKSIFIEDYELIKDQFKKLDFEKEFQTNSMEILADGALLTLTGIPANINKIVESPIVQEKLEDIEDNLDYLFENHKENKLKEMNKNHNKQKQ